MKPHISPSQISLYTKCGEAYRRRYIEKEIIPPGIALVKGTSIHKGAEYNFKQKIETHQDLKSVNIVDKSVDEYEKRIDKEGLLLTKKEESTGKNKIIGQGKDSTVRMAKLYSSEVAPKYQPRTVEQKQIIEMPNSTHDLLGIIDLLDDKDQIVDLKTSSKAWNQVRVDRSMQLTFYSMLHRTREKRNPTKIVVENLVDTKTSKLNTLETQRDVPDYQRLISRISAVVNGINKEVYAPANDGAWWCSKSQCGFFSSCKYVK